MINSKNKGNTYERKIANILSDRFAAYTGIPNSFRRNPDSGSFFGKTNAKRLTTHATDTANLGDIICPPGFCYSIECKHYKTAPGLKALLGQSVKDWDLWIEQAEQDAINSNKEPCIIVKYNNVDEFVIVRNSNLGGIPYKNYHLVQFKVFLTYKDEFYFGDK